MNVKQELEIVKALLERKAPELDEVERVRWRLAKLEIAAQDLQRRADAADAAAARPWYRRLFRGGA